MARLLPLDPRRAIEVTAAALRRIPGGGKLSVALGQDLTLATFTERLAETYGDREAFTLPEESVLAGRRSISFREADRAVGRLAGALRRSGVERGDAVAVVPSNGCDLLLSVLAVIRGGAVAVPINPVLKPPEVRRLVELSEARTIVVDPRTKRRSVGPKGDLPGVDRWLSLGATSGCQDLLGDHGSPAAPEAIGPDAVAAVLYTSGTTGKPKGARLTSEGLLSSISAVALHPSGLPGSLRLAVSALPVAHIMGLATALGQMLAGIPHRMFPRFDPEAVLDAIEGDRAGVFIGVPAMYRSLLDAGAERRDLSSIRAWGSASDVMPPDLVRRFQSMGRLAGPIPALFVDAYGMVELSGAAMIRVVPPGGSGRRRAAVPLPPYRVRVIDDRGRTLPRGRVGEVCVQGPGVLEGYQGDPEGTAEVLEGGWLRTGDLGRMGPFGTVIFEGRKKEVIKVGGYSVYPVEVEEEIRAHPDVADVAVVGVADRAKGQVPAAAVEPAPGSSLAHEDLERWAARHLAGYRRPRRWLILDELPRGSTGKADKRTIEGLFGDT